MAFFDEDAGPDGASTLLPISGNAIDGGSLELQFQALPELDAGENVFEGHKDILVDQDLDQPDF
jgi:hypothetical protein